MARMGGGLGDIMKQAQKMQQELMRVQEQLGTMSVEASSGGGMVTVVVNGRFEITSIKIEKDVVDPNDIEMLQDLVRAAVNEANGKAQEMVKEEMSKVTGGLPIPGLGL
jgi:DNA-binding YbaB/EbfC family protein